MFVKSIQHNIFFFFITQKFCLIHFRSLAFCIYYIIDWVESQVNILLTSLRANFK